MTTPLITRLEEAAEGCHLLDRELWVALEFDGRSSPADAPEYTTSIDEALALAVRVLGCQLALCLLRSVAEAVAEQGWPLSRVPPLICAAVVEANANHKDKT